MKRFSLLKVLLVIFPFGLIGLGIVSLLLYESRRLDQSELEPMTDRITVTGLQSKQSKLNEFMTPRGLESEEELRHAKRVMAFIEGSLSPQNIGMQLQSEKALTAKGRIWKRYRLEFEGKSKEEVLYRVGYLGGNNAVLAMGLELAESFPRMVLKERVTILFEPFTADFPQGRLEGIYQEVTDSASAPYAPHLIPWKQVKEKLVALRASHLAPR